MTTPAERTDAAPPSFALNLAKTLPFMLVCGIVGPIFLAIYFLSGRLEVLSWMLWMGLGITVLDVGIAVGVAAARTRSERRTYRLHRVGRRGFAEIVTLEQTGVRINDEPLLNIHVRISGPDLAPFEAQQKSVIADFRLPLLYTGPVPVLVDPETSEWEFDWDAARARPAAAVAGVAPPTDQRPRADRLAELDDLFQKDMLSREEYDAARARILGEL